MPLTARQRSPYSGVDIRYFRKEFLKKLGFQQVIGSSRSQNLILLLDAEVGPREGRIHVLTIQGQDLIVRNHAWVG